MMRALLLLVLLASCGLGTLDRGEFAASYPYGAGPYFSLRGMQEGLAAFGDAQITNLNIDPDNILITAQDPKNPQNYDTIQLDIMRGLQEPVPYQNPSESFAQELFSLRSVEPPKLVSVIKKAKEDLKAKEVALDGVSVRKEKDHLEIYISWEGPRARGSSYYLMDGTLLRTD